MKPGPIIAMLLILGLSMWIMVKTSPSDPPTPGATQFDLGNGFYEITATPVPEPSTYAAGLLALTAVAFHRRRGLGNLLSKVRR